MLTCSARTSSETRFDQVGLDRPPGADPALAEPLVVDAQRTLDGFARRFHREPSEAKRVAEQIGNALAEAVELGEAVLAQANQESRARRRAD